VQDGRGSSTAVTASVLRAAHQILDSQPRVLNDPISVGLVPGSAEDELRSNAQSHDLEFMRILRASFVLRSRIAEDALAGAVARGATQYVLIGAGFDTFAFRQPTWAAGLRIYELDHPATQHAKRTHLEQAGLCLPDNLKLCPTDLERQGISAGLGTVDFDPKAQTHFSLLGVLPYLSGESVVATLQGVRSAARLPSLPVSHVLPDSMLTGADVEVVSISSRASAARGEPWRSRASSAEMERALEDAGFDSFEHYGPEEFTDRLTADRADGLSAPSFERVVVASVTTEATWQDAEKLLPSPSTDLQARDARPQ
jgi:methyltransferase (TIGR00027 family)